jgi:chromosomal replication initiator protein
MTAISVDGLRDELRTRIKNEQAFRMWIQPMVLVEASANQLRLGFPSKFTADWVRDHYQHIFQEVVGAETRFVFEQAPAAEQRAAELAEAEVPSTLPVPALADDRPSSLPTTVPGPTAPARAPEPAMVSASMLEPRPPLNPNYTFDSFVVGPANELAWKAARASASDVAPRYNPLVIVGAVGLGKTHLLHAVGHAIQRLRPDARIHLRTTEEFTTDVVQGIRTQRMDEIRRLYRTCDVLLLDDIQFISSKPACQEEFFHTFNALVDQNKQIVLSADKSPSDLEGVEERVKSRLGWGLVADIHPTTYELRLGILQAKAERTGVAIPVKVLEFLAHKITQNIRELEGALNRITAHATLIGRPITIDSAQEVLHDLIRANDRRVTIEEIQKRVAEHFSIRLADMHSPRRARAVARPRQVAMYLSKQLTSRSLPEIGRKFGGRDHTTVMHAVRKIEELRASDHGFDEDIELLRRMLES